MKKQSKNLTKPVDNQQVKTESPTQSFPFTTRQFLYQWGLPIVGLVLFFLLFIERDESQIMHPWNSAFQDCDSSQKIQDPVQRKQVLEKGGTVIKAQLALHPYHARLWTMYAHYLVLRKDWDSSMFAAKKALELGAGAPVNSIEHLALQDLNFSLSEKLHPYYSQKEIALKVIQEAEVPGVQNLEINKFKGLVLANTGDYEECKSNLEKYLATNKNDFEALFAMALNYSKKGMKAESIEYLTKAEKINPNHPNLFSLKKAIYQ